MMLSSSFSLGQDRHPSFFWGLSLTPLQKTKSLPSRDKRQRTFVALTITVPKMKTRHLTFPSLDKLIKRNNKIRFVLKLKTLILSRPRRCVPLGFLEKYRSYLCFPNRITVREKVSLYPTIFEFFRLPRRSSRSSQLFVRLTKEAEALASEESEYHSSVSETLAKRVHKLLMLSVFGRILLSKIAHIHHDLGLPPNFRHVFCKEHSDRFRIVETDKGPALELVAWDSSLATPLPHPTRDRITDRRPLKFKTLNLRKGLALSKDHYEFLVKFQDTRELCPYRSFISWKAKRSMVFEKRTCAIIREVLGLTVEKWILIDHLTLFRKNFRLLKKIKGMLLRHPDLFHVSRRGQRYSVMLVEGFDYGGRLREIDGASLFRKRLARMVVEGFWKVEKGERASVREAYVNEGKTFYGDYPYVDGFENLFKIEEEEEEKEDCNNTKNEEVDADRFLQGWESWFDDPSSLTT